MAFRARGVPSSMSPPPVPTLLRLFNRRLLLNSCVHLSGSLLMNYSRCQVQQGPTLPEVISKLQTESTLAESLIKSI